MRELVALSGVARLLRTVLAGAAVIWGLDWAGASKMAHAHDWYHGEGAGRPGSAGSLEGLGLSLSLSFKVRSFTCLFIYINNRHSSASTRRRVLARIMVTLHRGI